MGLGLAEFVITGVKVALRVRSAVIVLVTEWVNVEIMVGVGLKVIVFVGDAVGVVDGVDVWLGLEERVGVIV